MAKAIKKQVLGRGLAALLQDSKTDQSKEKGLTKSPQVGTIVELELGLIELNPFQPRTQFNEESIRELATSIQELGVIQPITVRKISDTNFQLVSGERRLRATRLLDLKTIPAYIRIANDQEALEMALVENIQRQDLDPIEIALSYQRLMDDVKLTQEQMSQRIGKKRSTIANYLRLLKLDPISYNRIDIDNKQRLIRALEICIGSGNPYSYYLGLHSKKRNFKTIKIGLTAERETVYSRINQRVDLMMESGLLAEVNNLYQHREHEWRK